jgi:ATP-dependent helicase HepA
VLFRGMLVSLPEGRGVGKLESIDGDTCVVAVFRSIVRSETVQLSVADLTHAYLSPQTRVYVKDDDRFRVGRVADYLPNDNGLITYEVRFPNNKRGDFSELHLFLRPWSAPEDPAEILASGGAESQFLHDHRQAAMLPLLKLRGAAQGMTALVSAGIDLAPHQVAAVRRVLTDPIQRYLLADEVGLGKTIEAGLILRQHLIDDPATGVLLVVPPHLRAQWRSELETKLRLDQFDDAVEIIAHADLARVRRAPDILVIDEAHHLVGVQAGPLAPAAVKLRALAAEAPVLLLLSATPALGDEARFLALLNLLDPASHPIEDVEGFRRKLEGRREIGRLLLALDPDLPKLVLRQRGAEMARMFPDDPLIGELAPRLVAATREAPDQVAPLCAALKGHIADSYRVHQRLIRSRRADAQGWEFAARGSQTEGKPNFNHLRVEADDSGWAEPLLPVLEEWRFAACDAAAADEQTLATAAVRYAGLLTAVATGRAALTEWLSDAGQHTTFADESAILAQVGAIVEEAGEDNYTTACESACRLVRSLRGERPHPKIVAFASSVEGARGFHAALGKCLGDCDVLLLAGDGAEEDEDSLAAFIAPRTAAVLVCDRNGEEGLNLACADAILHLDLPLSAARIEQRIGRLDRFGRRNGVVRHRIVLAVDEDDSPWTGWTDFLCHGLGIFHRSISDVQFLLDGFELRLFRALLEEGTAGLEALSAEVREAIGEERRSQDEQYALDRIALAEEPVETFIAAVEDAEEDEAALEEGIDRWLVGALQLKKRPYAWPVQDPFKLGATRDTLIPKLPWLAALDLDEPRAMTWRRRIATAHPEAMLLRPGTPFVDRIERFTRWDDRGTAFVTWRTAPDWQDELWLGFRLCFVIEPDVPFADLFAPSRAELAASRQAQRYLSPRTVSLHFHANGEPVDDPALLRILERPYRSGSDSAVHGADLNLASRPQHLASVIDTGAFAGLCRSIRDTATAAVLADPSLRDAIAAGERLASAEIERRRTRLQQRRASGDATAQADLESIEALLPAIASPSITLDAMGCFIVSRHPPAAPSHA